MADKTTEKVNDIFRKINTLNDISADAVEADSEKYNALTRKFARAVDDMADADREINTDYKDFITLAKEATGQIKYQVKFKKLDERAVIPTYAHDGDVGMDMTAIYVEYNKEMDCYIYHTGLAFETDKHYGIFLFPRSSNRNTDAYLCNHVGIADSAIYRGEIMFCYKNRTSLEQRATSEMVNSFFSSAYSTPFSVVNGGNIEFTWTNTLCGAMYQRDYVLNNPMLYAPYQVGDRIGQMVVLPYPDIELSERQALTDTERGINGFGSTN